MCDIADKMKSRRIDLGLTLEDVAQAVGVGHSTVRKWETGMIKNMGRDKIAKLAVILQMNPVEFVPIPDATQHERLSVEDEELRELWGGASLQAKRMALTVLKQFREEDNHDLY